MAQITIWSTLVLSISLIVISAVLYVLSVTALDSNDEYKKLARGIALSFQVLAAAGMVFLLKILKPLQILRDDMEQLTFMDAKCVVTECERHLSVFSEVQDMQLTILQLLDTVRNCRPFLPDTVIKALNEDKCRSIANDSIANIAETVGQMEIPHFVFGDGESSHSGRSESNASDESDKDAAVEAADVFLLSINDVPSSAEDQGLRKPSCEEGLTTPGSPGEDIFRTTSLNSRRSTLPLILGEASLPEVGGYARRQSVAHNLAGFEAFRLEHPQTLRRSSIPTQLRPSVSLRMPPNNDHASLQSLFEFGMRRRKGTIMLVEFGVSEFIDYEGEDDLYLLASTLTGMAIDFVKGSGGNVLHLTADSLTASWNTHHPVARHAVHACRSAVSIKDTLEEAVANDQDRVSFSVSIVGGLVYCGNIGNDSQRSPFVLGHLVAQARMLNQLSKMITAPLLMTESVVDTIRAQGVKYRPVDVVSWKMESRRREVVYELLSEKFQYDDTEWKDAFHLFMSERFNESLKKFENLRHTDYQRRRLILLIRKMEDSEEDIPRPYARAMKGWETWEYTQTSPMLRSCKVNSRRSLLARKRSRNREASLSSFTRKRSPSPTSHGSDLLLAIQEIQRSETLSQQSQASDYDSENSDLNTTVCTMTYDDPPTQFTSNDCLFRRSERLLGKGAFGDVWLGMTDEGSLVAMKVIKVPPPEQPTRRRLCRGNDVVESVTSIINEVELLSKFHDDTIVSFIACGVHDKYVIIIMEYVSGGSLADVLETFGALKPATAKRFTKDIIRGLHYLHNEGILHRDLKPGNVLMHTDGQCKLSDFGTCTTLTEIAGGGAGGAMGTALFMSPEASRGEPCKASDLWALGLTVIQMLQNTTPFEWAPDIVPTSSFQFLRWLGKLRPTDEIPLPEVNDATLDQCAHSFIKRLLVFDPTERGDASTLLFDPFVM
eukprot:TRINITY_DN8001_c0_g1_i2.p1 TRINITY_DN8001_c0_g1~~TRINITY_DN8001_c0_g1_i2.p1  ORF type:complete len:945 (+),score=167.44 TRINITY_DN8001_c0_g1_i2:79-2913(+)